MRTNRELDRLATFERSGDILRDLALASILDRTQHLREQSNSLPGSMLIDEQAPRCGERLVERGGQLVSDLAQRLWLVRELA